MAGFRDEVELANAAYGQAEVLVTPLQMALVAATIANDGLLMKPKLVDELRASDGSVTRLGPPAWAQVVSTRSRRRSSAMRCSRPSRDRYGEGLAGAAKVPGVPTAGKSGTAQLGGDAAPHAGSSAYAPADAPQIAIAVDRRGRRCRRPAGRADGRRSHEPRISGGR